MWISGPSSKWNSLISFCFDKKKKVMCENMIQTLQFSLEMRKKYTRCLSLMVFYFPLLFMCLQITCLICTRSEPKIDPILYTIFSLLDFCSMHLSFYKKTRKKIIKRNNPKRFLTISITLSGKLHLKHAAAHLVELHCCIGSIDLFPRGETSTDCKSKSTLES